MIKTLLNCVFLLAALASGWSATTIGPVNSSAYGANLGWLDWRGDTNSGAVIGEYVCSGHIWGANVGWIHLGSGAAVNGLRYQNNSANDYGVNHDGLGNLAGLAWGQNIGWVVFTNATSAGAMDGADVPRVNLTTGRLSGYAYGANCGWISLSNAFAQVQTDSLQPGADTDADGIADAWELTHTNSLTRFNASGDTDADGASDVQEYLADTDPNDPASRLLITAYSTDPGGTPASLTWQSQPTRHYYVEQALGLSPSPSWFDSGLGLVAPDGATTTRMISGTSAPTRVYRVQGIRPLIP